MDVVVDANILFAALIRDNVTSDLMLKDSLHLFAPEFIFMEFEKYRELIKSRTERTEEEFNTFLEVLERRISLIPMEEIKPFLKKAREISPDKKDVPYLALALRMNIPIWSNDRELREKQTAVRVFNTEEIMRL